MQNTALYDPRYMEKYNCVDCTSGGTSGVKTSGSQKVGRVPPLSRAHKSGLPSTGGGGGGGDERSSRQRRKGGTAKSDKASKKLKAYRDIVKHLVTTVERAEGRRAEREEEARTRRPGMSLHKSASTGAFMSPALRYQLGRADRELYQDQSNFLTSPAQSAFLTRSGRIRPMTQMSRTRTPTVAQTGDRWQGMLRGSQRIGKNDRLLPSLMAPAQLGRRPQDPVHNQLMSDPYRGV